ncbi:MAG TPA: adenosylcobinamide amidohydrolase [Deltaproteobacteria bacterium]|nr:adenosylcobinamide amidohydrolase [Deltaproteobacteria bacterium]
MKTKTLQRAAALLLLLLLAPAAAPARDYPLVFTDSAGVETRLDERPRRVVSLSPAVTEMLFRIGAADAVAGITYHDTSWPQAAGKEVVGGFVSPDIERIEALAPDLVFHSALNREALSPLRGHTTLVNLSARTVAEGFEEIELLGRIFGREQEAAAVVAEQRRLLELTARKTALIPAEQRLRVMRIMGRERLMAPGDDSFQNEYIRAAGAIAPHWGRDGAVVPVSAQEWLAFDPQVVYGCGGDRALLSILHSEPWNGVEAVKEGRIYFFPCELTCRVSTHAGYFTAWLAATVYEDLFAGPGNTVLPAGVIRRRPLSVELPYVERAELVESDVFDFRNKTLVVTFSEPMEVLSTLDGPRSGVTAAANHYFPPPAWGLGHRLGVEGLRRETLAALGLDPASTAVLFTGADMDDAAVVTESFREMEVTVVVTAGVTGNAMRMGYDEGAFYEPERRGPGTVNIIVMTNMRLTGRAMARAVVTATEAKSAALQDLDIRSSYSGAANGATGTGTDNVMVVEGRGPLVDAAGGHTKMGELIARAVRRGVMRAVEAGNGLRADRPVFRRLRERGIEFHGLCSVFGGGDRRLCAEAERLLLDPFYAGFVESMLAVSDGVERGLVADSGSVGDWADAVAARIAGRPVRAEAVDVPGVPPVLSRAVGAIFSGLAAREADKASGRPAAGPAGPGP